MNTIISPELVKKILEITQPVELERELNKLSQTIAALPSTSLSEAQVLQELKPLLPHLIKYAPIAYVSDFLLSEGIQTQIESDCADTKGRKQIVTLMKLLSERASEVSPKEIEKILEIVISYYKIIFLIFATYEAEEKLDILQLTQETIDQFYCDNILENAACHSAIDVMESFFFCTAHTPRLQNIKSVFGC